MRVLQTSCAALLISGFAAFAETENLLQNASFEEPRIEGRVDEHNGGGPARLQDGTSWAHFQTMDPSGAVSVGLTNEIARTGKQSIYVDFQKVSNKQEAFLMTDLVPVKELQTYRISIWGRLDRKHPLTLVGARTLLRVEMECYKDDLETQLGDTEYRTQQMPGSPRRVLFEAGRWNEYFTEVKTPAETAFMKITFRWQSTGEGGDASGTIFFDDAVATSIADKSNEIGAAPATSESNPPVKTPPAPPR